jgi:hypothetical protein
MLIFILVSYETYDACMWLRVFLRQNVWLCNGYSNLKFPKLLTTTLNTWLRLQNLSYRCPFLFSFLLICFHAVSKNILMKFHEILSRVFFCIIPIDWLPLWKKPISIQLMVLWDFWNTHHCLEPHKNTSKARIYKKNKSWLQDVSKSLIKRY